jgi:hypothetical protein
MCVNEGMLGSVEGRSVYDSSRWNGVTSTMAVI